MHEWSAIATLILGVFFGGVAWADVAQSAQEAIRAAAPGDIVRLTEFPLSEDQIPLVPMRRQPLDGPQFLLSDKPEYFRTGDGISLRERVEPGTVRLYLYHVPEPMGTPKTISAVIENLGDAPLRFTFRRYAFPKPGGDYHAIGKAGLVGYFNNEPPSETRTLAPGKRMVIDPALDATVVTKDQLVHGFYEFDIDQPAVVTVFQRSPDADSLTIIDELPELPPVLPGQTPSGAGRGLFLTADFGVSPADDEHVVDTASGPQQIVIADGERDPWIAGRDSLSATETTDPVLNKGNYGVIYRIRVPYRSSDGRALALLTYNPRAGAKWCGAQALALQIDGSTVLAPANQVRYGAPPEAVLLATFEPLAPGQDGMIEITYSPPGASCLPTPLLFVPYDPAPVADSSNTEARKNR